MISYNDAEYERSIIGNSAVETRSRTTAKLKRLVVSYAKDFTSVSPVPY
jgi:hypothetical protein